MCIAHARQTASGGPERREGQLAAGRNLCTCAVLIVRKVAPSLAQAAFG